MKFNTWGARLLLAGMITHSVAASAKPTVSVVPAVALMHEDVQIQVRGLKPGQDVTLRAGLVDDAKVAWRSEATYRADRSGRVDLRKASALSGTYNGIEPQGLLWSMRPAGADKLEFVGKAATDPRHSMVPVLDRSRRFAVSVTALQGGQQVGQAIVRRGWLDDRVRRSEVSDGELRGILYEPVRGRARSGVVVLTGSGGGVDRDWAPLLASRGHAVLALGYFGYKDRPRFPADLPIEYFADSLRWMRGHLGHSKVGLIGISRGTEAAFLTAAHFPDLVQAVVAIAPGHMSTPGFHPQRGLSVSTWSLGGKPLPFSAFPSFSLPQLKVAHGNPQHPLRQADWYTEMYQRPGESDRFGLPVERMRAPILLLSGTADAIWPSQFSANYIADRLARARYAFPVRNRVIDGAGHGIWMSPGSVATYAHLDFHNLAQAFTTSGGSPMANARGAAEAFRETDRFLAKTLR